jgi:predicted nucleic acid-binding protein
VPVFVDANVLVYAEDRDAGDKHLIARDFLTIVNPFLSKSSL